jgi:hypothetical protein
MVVMLELEVRAGKFGSARRALIECALGCRATVSPREGAEKAVAAEGRRPAL